MSKPLYVCVVCGEHFTRHANAKRHNFNLHRNSGEIVSWTEYLVGRSTNRYQPSYPSMSRRGRYNSQRTTTTPTATTVADSMGDFRPMGVQVQEQGERQQQQYQPYQQQQAPPILSRTTMTATPNAMSQYLALRDRLFQICLNLFHTYNLQRQRTVGVYHQKLF